MNSSEICNETLISSLITQIVYILTKHAYQYVHNFSTRIWTELKQLPHRRLSVNINIHKKNHETQELRSLISNHLKYCKIPLAEFA